MTYFHVAQAMNHVEFMREIVTMTLIVRVNNLSVLTTKPLKDVVQGHSNQVKDLSEAQKRYNYISPHIRLFNSRNMGTTS